MRLTDILRREFDPMYWKLEQMQLSRLNLTLLSSSQLGRPNTYLRIKVEMRTNQSFEDGHGSCRDRI